MDTTPPCDIEWSDEAGTATEKDATYVVAEERWALVYCESGGDVGG